MKRTNYILSVFLIVISHFVQAEGKNDSWMLTDREVYVSGENLYVKIFTPSDQNFKVLYLSLTSSEGFSVTSAKLSIENHQASGYLYLPDSLQTGSFLLTVYSSHYIKQAFFRKEIVVLNRFENQDQPLVFERAQMAKMRYGDDSGISIRGLNQQYKQRETISLPVILGDKLLSELDSQLAVVVSETVPGWETQCSPVEPDFDSSQLMSKQRGVVLEGVVSNVLTNEPVSGATVYLIKPDSIPYFDYYTTWKDGRFYFLLKDFYGNYPLVIQAVKDDETPELKVKLDDRVSDKPEPFELKTQNLDAATQTCFSEAISVVTFKKIYQAQECEFYPVEYHPTYPFPFYGKPMLQVDPDEFFELNDFNEISKELLGPVRFRDKKGAYSLNIIDREFGKFFEEQPLITIDGVPVQDLAEIASLGSREIDWIDVVPYQRFYGNAKFDGVLAIYTKKLDASLIGSGDNILKLNYEILQGDIRLVDPPATNDHSPDFRQVLLWEPELSANKELELNFKTSDIIGTYKVQVTGRKKNGDLVEVIRYFSVTK